MSMGMKKGEIRPVPSPGRCCGIFEGRQAAETGPHDHPDTFGILFGDVETGVPIAIFVAASAYWMKGPSASSP
jgi:hypothetical protein